MSINKNPTVPVSLDALAVGRSSSSPFLTAFETRNPNTGDVNYPLQTRWYNTVTEGEYILTGYSVVSNVKTAIWQPVGASAVVVTETLTGNTGSAVGVDSANNINTVGDGTTITIVGNPATHTLTASTTGAIATLYTEDTGTATPSAGNLNIRGAAGITTSGAGNTVTITAGATIPTTFNEDSGSATPAANALTIAGGTLISTSGAGHTVTINNTAGTNPQTYTPVLTFGGASVGITYASQLGTYFVIGKIIFLNIDLGITNKGSSTGLAKVSLPITSGTTAVCELDCTVIDATYPAGTTQTSIEITSGNLVGTVIGTGSGANQQFDDTFFTNITDIRINGIYYSA